jgi:hypothetical protein
LPGDNLKGGWIELDPQRALGKARGGHQHIDRRPAGETSCGDTVKRLTMDERKVVTVEAWDGKRAA